MYHAARPAALLFLCFALTSCDSGAPPAETETAAAATAAKEETPAEPCRLTMGWDPWEPYHYMNPVGEINGLDVEIVSAIAADAGCEVSFERDSWASLLRRIQDGSVDLILKADIDFARQRPASRLLDLVGGGVDGAGQLRMRLSSLRRNDDVRAVAGRPQRNRLADTPAGSGDEEGFVVEIRHRHRKKVMNRAASASSPRNVNRRTRFCPHAAQKAPSSDAPQLRQW